MGHGSIVFSASHASIRINPTVIFYKIDSPASIALAASSSGQPMQGWAILIREPVGETNSK
jgi:hypothetical protein